MRKMNSQMLGVLKKVIRAILIAEQSKGMPLRILERQYRESEGTSMPLLGYPDTAALLNSLTDTVFMAMSQGQLFVYPVETENTKHVSDLVRNTQTRSAGRRSRGAPSRILDQTIVNKRINQYLNNMTKNGGSRTHTNGHRNNSPMQNGHSTQTSRGYRQQPQWQQQQQQQQQNGHSHQRTTAAAAAAAPESSSVHFKQPQQQQQQSNDQEKRTEEKPHDERANAANADKIRLDSDDDSDCDYEEWQRRQSKKESVARYLMAFHDENIHLGDLPSMELEKIFEPGRSLRLTLSEVHSPFKFWFHLDENTDAIDSLMDRLNMFYYQNHDDQTMMAHTAIPDEFLDIGLTCAALYHSEWHRGKIVAIFDDTVKVFYVDYGTVSEAFKKDIRFLDKQFATKPAFAIRGCLDRVRPNDSVWTFHAMEMFQDTLKEFFTVPMLGKVTLLNLPERTIYLDLIDTTGRHDNDMGKLLILENVAYAARKLLFNYQQRHYNEVYPSFEKLENGTYPQFSEIKELMNWNFDFLAFEYNIIIPEMYGYQTIE